MSSVDLKEFEHLMKARDDADHGIYEHVRREVEPNLDGLFQPKSERTTLERPMSPSPLKEDNPRVDGDVDEVPQFVSKFNSPLSMSDGFYLTLLYHKFYGVFTSNFEIDDEVMECMVIPLKPNGIKKYDRAMYNVFKVIPIEQKGNLLTHTVFPYIPDMTDPRWLEWHKGSKVGKMRPCKFGKFSELHGNFDEEKMRRNASRKKAKTYKERKLKASEKKYGKQDKYWLRWNKQ